MLKPTQSEQPPLRHPNARQALNSWKRIKACQPREMHADQSYTEKNDKDPSKRRQDTEKTKLHSEEPSHKKPSEKASPESLSIKIKTQRHAQEALL